MSALKGTSGIFMLVALCAPAFAQEADAGFTLPVTITGGALYTRRTQIADPAAGRISAAFHAALYPSLKLSPHWFAYSSVQLRSTPFYYYDTYESGHELKADVAQAFLGYSRTHKTVSVLIKVGQLSSAFGSFPLHYDDSDNPLLDQPPSYISYLNLRPDQLPCNGDDIIYGNAYAGSVTYHCGGSHSERDGLTPVTLYGLPGVELDLSVNKVDTRFQLTNSSPANPQSLLSGSQHAQWTAGAGYTLIQGLRAGFSAFHGPFMDRVVAPFLPAGKTVRNFPATGAGLDLQWARGRWSTSGEWQRFHFSYPGFRVSPTATFAYAEVKTVLNARTYLALRAGYQRNGHLEDLTERTDETFAPNHQSYEVAIGFRPNRWQLLKVGYEWLKTSDMSGNRDNAFGIQLVTSIQTVSKAWR